MSSVYEVRRGEQTSIQRNIVQGSARYCSSSFGKCAKALWPVKTAEQLAAILGCSVRTAAYQISGEHEPSALAIAAIVVEITKRS